MKDPEQARGAGIEIFLSYRRHDLQGQAHKFVGRLFDSLSSIEGVRRVFMDKESIPPGRDFADYIGKQVPQTDVLLAVIGPQWTELLRKRREVDEDFVRIEIALAFDYGIPVIPILLEDAKMPNVEDLPPCLCPLARCNAYPFDLRGDHAGQVVKLAEWIRKEYSISKFPQPKTSYTSLPPEEFTNSLGMLMRWCRPGSFMMGSPTDEEGREPGDVRETLHAVTLRQFFWISAMPVSQGVWKEVIGLSIEQQRERGDPRGQVTGNALSHPIYFVNWNEALEFCDALTRRDRKAGKLPFGLLYTLPTEAQWEYACRAGVDGPWNDADRDPEDLGWFQENSHGSTHPAGEKMPNSWGLFDMHGNVYEWCADGRQESLGHARSEDPLISPSGSEGRVVRGGSWDHSARRCRSAARNFYQRYTRSARVGLRPVLAPREQRSELGVPLPPDLVE